MSGLANKTRVRHSTLDVFNFLFCWQNSVVDRWIVIVTIECALELYRNKAALTVSDNLRNNIQKTGSIRGIAWVWSM